MLNIDNINKVYEVERLLEYEKWAKVLKPFRFKKSWKVHLYPPYGGALIRFTILKDKAKIDVFLDCYGNLGLSKEPYWEIFPNSQGEAQRFPMNERIQLMIAIVRSIKKQNKKDGK